MSGDSSKHANVAADLADDASRAFIEPSCSAKERHVHTVTLALLSLAHSCAAIAQLADAVVARQEQREPRGT